MGRDPALRGAVRSGLWHGEHTRCKPSFIPEEVTALTDSEDSGKVTAPAIHRGCWCEQRTAWASSNDGVLHIILASQAQRLEPSVPDRPHHTDEVASNHLPLIVS